MELTVFKSDGNTTSRKVALNDSVFGIEPNDHAIYLDVKAYLAAQRQGTSSSKERSMLSGSTRKLKKQKGTGGARSGDINSPLFPGGARVFGPQPRDYRMKVNKKVKQLARKSALTYKARENQIIVLEDFDMGEIKTRNYKAILDNLKAGDGKSLMVLPESNTGISLSSRNLPGAKVLTAVSLNTYDILNAKKILFFESSLPKIEEILIH